MQLYLHHTDRLADAVVADFSGLRPGEGSAMLGQALARGIQHVEKAPDSLKDMFADLQREPMWLDWAEVDYGAQTFMRSGSFGACALLCHSLPTGYLDPVSSKPLLFSGRLVQRAPRRLMETARFVYECCKPGGMRPEGAGFQISIRVRLMHAQVRRLLLKSGKWETENWGKPISQYHMLGTNVLFSLAVLDALRRWGLHISAREEQAVFALWRYNGFLMGIDRDVLPANLSESRRIMDSLELSRPPADQSSRELMQSLIDAAAEMSVSILGFDMQNMVRSVLHGLTRNLLGRARANELGLASTLWLFLPWMLWPVVRGFEYARYVLPGSRRLAIAIGESLWNRSLQIGLQGREAQFNMPAALNQRRSKP